jgi:hypothetical protein
VSVPAGYAPKAAFRPLWWSALVTLALNDHALKGSGLLPGWLTGKLSDFAGLVVAPVLVAVAVGARSRRAAAAIVLAVGSGFTALKLSRTLADGFEAPFLALGVPCRLWTDPTDLVALLVLPFVYELLARADVVDAGRSPRRQASWLDSLGVALGGLACMATSIAENPRGIGFVVNATHEDLRISMREAADSLDCTLLATNPQAAIAGVGLKQGTCNDTPPREGVVIRTPPSLPCGFVVLSTPGLPPTALFWTNLEERSLAFTSTPDADGDVRSYLHRVGDVLYLDVAPTMDTLPYPRNATDACASSP